MSKGPKQSRTTGRSGPGRKPGAGDAERLLATAMKQHQGGQLQAAEAVYRQALLAWPENADAWHRLGTLYAQAEHFDRALTCLAKAAELSPENAAFRSDLGNAHMAVGRTDEAIDHYEAALAQDEIVQVQGERDRSTSLDLEQAQDARITQAGLSIRKLSHEGGHEIDRELLQTLL